MEDKLRTCKLCNHTDKQDKMILRQYKFDFLETGDKEGWICEKCSDKKKGLPFFSILSKKDNDDEELLVRKEVYLENAKETEIEEERFYAEVTVKRKEWFSLSREERDEYLELCYDNIVSMKCSKVEGIVVGVKEE